MTRLLESKYITRLSNDKSKCTSHTDFDLERDHLNHSSVRDLEEVGFYGKFTL